MSAEAWVVILGTGPVFAIGWFARGLYDSLKETRVDTPTKRRFRPFTALFDWFSHGNRLIGLVVFCVALGVSALVYTFTADQQSEGRNEDLVACIGRYVSDTSTAQAPRTAASVAASDARRDWDQGFSAERPDLNRAQLKLRYLHLYQKYETVRAFNPTLTPFSLEYCEGK